MGEMGGWAERNDLIVRSRRRDGACIIGILVERSEAALYDAHAVDDATLRPLSDRLPQLDQ